MNVSKKIEVEILKFMEDYRRPVSTREIALATNRAWHSINSHCLKLQLASEVSGFRVGNMNLWELRRKRR